MNLESRSATKDAGYDDKLADLGIPILYVDCREDPTQHSSQSMRIMGMLAGNEDNFEAYINFADQQTTRVTYVLAGPSSSVLRSSLIAPAAMATTAA